MMTCPALKDSRHWQMVRMAQVGAIALSALYASAALAKLPPPSPEAVQKATEAAARADWTNRVAQFQLCQVQDRIASNYRRQAGKSDLPARPQGLADCTDPGPFSVTPPSQKPLEAAGAHSPPGTAATPPSTGVPHAQNKDGKVGGAAGTPNQK